MATGVPKYDDANKPVRTVGSVIDIDKRKQTEILITEKMDEPTKLNALMVGRELKMISLKEEINTLKKPE